MDASFCRFRVTVRVSRVMIRFMVSVRIRVMDGIGLPVPEYGYGKNARSATEGYRLPVLYTQPEGKTRLPR